MPLTRSSELLYILDGLCFIDHNMIDLAAKLYNELRAIRGTFGEHAIDKLVPHVSSIMHKLNDLCKENSDLRQEVDSLNENLAAAAHRCANLDTSYKEKAIECCEIEDQHESEMRSLSSQLAQCKEQNKRFQEAFKSDFDTARLLAESQEKITLLSTERIGLLTSIEVLEADVKCLRAELRRMENGARQRRNSTADSLLAELNVAEQTFSVNPSLPTTTEHTLTSPPAVDTDTDTTRKHTSCPQSSSQQNFKDFKDVLLIGDSHLRYSSKKCVYRGAYLECCPGGKILDIKNRLLNYVGVSLSVIYIHVGSNNLRKGYRGGPGYNGGYGKREALHSMADMLYTAKTSFPNSKIILDSVLIRRDISNRALSYFNEQLELMCNNFGVEYVEAHCHVGMRDLARDGVHFNRRGVARLGSLFVDTISAGLGSLDAAQLSPPGWTGSPAPAPAPGWRPGDGAVGCSGGGLGHRAGADKRQSSGN